MLGKNAARACGDVGVGGDQLRLGLGDVGAALQELGRQPGAHRRAADLIQAAVRHVDALGRVAGEDRERIDALAQLLPQGGHGGVHRGDHRLLLRHVEPGGGAGHLLELQALQDLGGVGEVRLGDGEAVAQLERLEIGGGDAGHDGEFDGRAVVGAGARRGRGGVVGGAVLAPEVELVARRQQRAEGVAGDEALAADRRPRALRARLRIERRQQRRAGDAPLRVRLVHARHRRAQVVVGMLRLGDELIEITARRSRATSRCSATRARRRRRCRSRPAAGECRDGGSADPRLQAARTASAAHELRSATARGVRRVSRRDRPLRATPGRRSRTARRSAPAGRRRSCTPGPSPSSRRSRPRPRGSGSWCRRRSRRSGRSRTRPAADLEFEPAAEEDAARRCASASRPRVRRRRQR